jgi:hypothetical protein
MADQSHLAKLREGVEAWNSWRKEYPNERPDLRSAKLTNCSLSYVDFSNATISHAFLVGATLSNANLFNAHLYDANLSKANLSNANLYRADLSNANLTGANLRGADLRRATLAETAIAGAIFTGCAVDGISAWGLRGVSKDQSNLIITSPQARPTFLDRDRPCVFLCYARPDGATVKELYRFLSDGFKPWMDTEDILPGLDWEPAIDKAIKHSDFFILCLSPNSIDRRGMMQKEMRTAFEKKKEMLDDDIYMIPVRLQECTVRDEKIRQLQWVDLFLSDGHDKLLFTLYEGLKRREKWGPTEMNEPSPQGSGDVKFQYWDRRARILVAAYGDRGFDTTTASIFRKMDILIKQTEGTKGSVEDVNKFEALVHQLNQLAIEPKRALGKFRGEAYEVLSPDDIDRIEMILKPFETAVDNALQTADNIKTKLAEMRAEFD